jgi:hypothetical protein
MLEEHATTAEVAEFLGLSTRAIADLGKRGIAVKARPGRWRLRESVARYCHDPRRQARGMGGEAVIASAAAERGRSSQRAGRRHHVEERPLARLSGRCGGR